MNLHLVDVLNFSDTRRSESIVVEIVGNKVSLDCSITASSPVTVNW